MTPPQIWQLHNTQPEKLGWPFIAFLSLNWLIFVIFYPPPPTFVHAGIFFALITAEHFS